MGKRVDWDDVIGSSGVCEILGIKTKSDLRQLRRRDPDFPEPDKWLDSRCPAWDARRVVAYKRRRGKAK